MLSRNGHWPEVERWKAALAQIASQYQSTCNVELFDFTGFNSVTTESIAGLTAAHRPENYWEASHFKDNVGKLILKRIFAPMHRYPPALLSRSMLFPVGTGSSMRARTTRNYSWRSRGGKSTPIIEHCGAAGVAVNAAGLAARAAGGPAWTNRAAPTVSRLTASSGTHEGHVYRFRSGRCFQEIHRLAGERQSAAGREQHNAFQRGQVLEAPAHTGRGNGVHRG